VSTHQLTARRGLFAGVVAAALVTAACSTDRASVAEPFGDPAYGFAIVRAGINVPRGSVVFQRPLAVAPVVPTNDTSLTVTLAGLDSLVTGVYKVWLADVDPATDAIANAIPATGLLTVTVTDTTIDPVTLDPIVTPTKTTFDNVSTFSNGGPRTSVSLKATPVSVGGIDVYLRPLVLVTIEQDAAAAEPGTVRPLWARRATTAPIVTGATPEDSVVRRTATVTFGNFRANPDSQYVFNAVGVGRASVFGTLFQAVDSGVARPPQGYYYEGSLALRDSASSVDRDTVNLGPLMSPFPRYRSLLDADMSEVDPVVQDRPYSILAGVHRAEAADLAGLATGSLPYKGVAEYRLTLEAKAGQPDVAAPTVVLLGVAPDVVRYGKQ